MRVHRLLGFGVLSLALHAAAFTAMRRGANRAEPPAFDTRPQPLAGESLDVEPPSIAQFDDEPADWTATATTPATHATGATPAAARPPSTRGRTFGATPAAAAAMPVPFGAVGVRFATDLATTFTRAFPQAASADPLWSAVSFGSAGRAEVTLVLDSEGHLAASEVDGSPSGALRRGIERTLVLLATREFTARGAVTKLRIVARVSRDDVHDGLHGDVFALSAGSFSGDVGAAFFALPPAAGPGRRVDVEIRLLP
jgi:hypothetical protein